MSLDYHHPYEINFTSLGRMERKKMGCWTWEIPLKWPALYPSNVQILPFIDILASYGLLLLTYRKLGQYEYS